MGEALVGNEAVDQLTKFDRALRDFSSGSGSGKGRGIDGMLVTKWDTVDDKVCDLISASTTSDIRVGWCGTLDDIRDGPTNYFCRMWSGLFFLLILS